MGETRGLFKVGDEVVIKTVRSRWNKLPLYTRSKVRKIYKSGNFVLEGSNKQWRNDLGALKASPVGQDYDTSLCIYGTVVKEEIAINKKIGRIKKEYRECREMIKEMTPDTPDDEEFVRAIKKALYLFREHKQGGVK